MTQAELIDAIAEQTGRPKTEAARFLQAFADNLTAELAQGGELRLNGFGAFAVADRAASEGRNPRTGEPLQILAQRVARFRPAAALKSALNPEPALRRERA